LIDCLMTSPLILEIADVSGMSFGHTSTQFWAYPHSCMPPSKPKSKGPSGKDKFCFYTSAAVDFGGPAFLVGLGVDPPFWPFLIAGAGLKAYCD